MVKVWAPKAKQAELILANSRHSLAPSYGGWWTANVHLPHGADYQFCVNGDILPDPRSAWQPSGVHGPSRYYDHRQFQWRCDEWSASPWRDAIVYELHIGTFSPEGTFAAAVSRLDHLVQLGVTHVELMPVAEFLGGHGWGYDGVFPYAPHHSYGGPDGLKTFVDAAHNRGLAVLLDVVYNHLGPSGNCLPQFGPYFTERYQTPWGPALNFDGPGSDEVREFFIDNALMWLRDYRFDGLRLDAVHAILDHSAIHFLEQLSTEVAQLAKQLGRELTLIAESDLNDPRLIRPIENGGYGLAAQWSDDIHHAVHTVLTQEHSGYYEDFEGLAHLAAAMASPYVYAGNYSRHRGRRHGRPPTNLPADRFVVYLQNHDQVGNRAQGERITQLVSADLARLGAAIVLLSPYVPLIFQGEEWGASSPFQYFVEFASEPDLAANVLKGRQTEFAAFGWERSSIPDPNDAATFHRSKLPWQELEQQPHRELLAWYRSLITLRQSPVFHRSRYQPAHLNFDDERKWMVIDRGELTIAINFSDRAQQIVLPEAGACRRLLGSHALQIVSNEIIEFPPQSIAVLEKTPELGIRNESGQGTTRS